MAAIGQGSSSGDNNTVLLHLFSLKCLPLRRHSGFFFSMCHTVSWWGLLRAPISLGLHEQTEYSLWQVILSNILRILHNVKYNNQIKVTHSYQILLNVTVGAWKLDGLCVALFHVGVLAGCQKHVGQLILATVLLTSLAQRATCGRILVCICLK